MAAEGGECQFSSGLWLLVWCLCSSTWLHTPAHTSSTRLDSWISRKQTNKQTRTGCWQLQGQGVLVGGAWVELWEGVGGGYDQNISSTHMTFSKKKQKYIKKCHWTCQFCPLSYKLKWRFCLSYLHLEKSRVLHLYFFFQRFIYLIYMKRASDPSLDGCELPCSCWELNSGPPEEQIVPLTTEPPPQSPECYLYTYLMSRTHCKNKIVSLKLMTILQEVQLKILTLSMEICFSS